MSIQSEITRISQGVAAAKTAVTTKGGTVSTTSIDDLANEIATIPQGSPEPQDNLYGMLIYQPDLIVEIGEEFFCDNCEMEVVDEEKYNAFLAEVFKSSDMPDDARLEMNYNEGEWTYRKGWEEEPLDQEAAGISLTITDPDAGWASVMAQLKGTYTGIATIYLQEGELDNLCVEDQRAPIEIQGKTIPKTSIIGFNWGESTYTEIPDYFMYYCQNLIILDKLLPDGVVTIGNRVFEDDRNLICPIDYRFSSEEITIGNSFLYQTGYNGVLYFERLDSESGEYLPMTVTVGSSFLCNSCSSVVFRNCNLTVGYNFCSTLKNYQYIQFFGCDITVVSDNGGILGGLGLANKGLATYAEILVNDTPAPTFVNQSYKSFSLGWSYNTELAYRLDGLKLSGNSSELWKTAFPVQTSPVYRKYTQ